MFSSHGLGIFGAGEGRPHWLGQAKKRGYLSIAPPDFTSADYFLE
jgi:hypothetical protein